MIRALSRALSRARAVATLAAVTAVTALCLTPGLVAAQAAPPAAGSAAGVRVHVDLAAGALFGHPGVGAGYAGLAGLEVATPLRGVSVRGDVMAGRLSTDAGGDVSLLSVTANVVFYPLPRLRARPYVIGGGGYYTADAASSLTSRGWTFNTASAANVGAGVAFDVARRAAFVEARVHRVLSPQGTGGRERVSFVPLVVGLSF